MDILNDAPIKKLPAGESINDLTKEINWPIPTWIEQNLYNTEFRMDKNTVVSMLNAIGQAIEKAMQSDAADSESIQFNWFRKHKLQRKKHALLLSATLYEHPDYGTIWLEITYGG